MNTLTARQKMEDLLHRAGISIHGSNPWDIQVYNDRFFADALIHGSLGVGESYMKKWWDCSRLDEFFARILKVSLDKEIVKEWRLFGDIIWSRLFNLQSIKRSFQLAQKHYDLGNDLFERMLDENMVYSCAYWKNALTLDEAQAKKLDLTCRKLNLRPGMEILDVGCGWGSFAKFAAGEYRVRVTGITVSPEQVVKARKMCEGLPVDIQLKDYREITGKFDRIVSIGMFEHVGYKNYRSYMRLMHRCLKDDGLFLLHTIGGNTSSTWTDPWIGTYIFPGSLLPSIKQMGAAIEGLFVLEDWHNFSADYDRTLLAWHQNFTSRWNEIKDRYGEKFYRMWSYYLLVCAGSFRARKNQLWQIVLSKNGIPGGYQSVR
ncbi:MAG TPA: cyclopropane fatty acyl phospholipid synthase [Cyclobacteriaceae bacterium]|nr:cyclopropane fatty acyl phospholipid synthase [Cyclobacteriaceae bacterium]